MKYKKFLFGAITSVGVVFCMFLLSRFFGSRPSRKNNQIAVGVAYECEPFSFVENDELVGFDVDLMSSLSKYMGKEAQFKTMSLASLMDSLLTGKIDVAISGIQEDQINRSEFDVIPYKTIFVSNFRCLMSLEGPSKKGQNQDPAVLKGKIGVVAGTPEEFFLVAAKKDRGEGLKIFSLPDTKALTAALRTGAINSALVLNYQFLRLNEDSDANFKCASINPDAEDGNDLVYEAVIVVRKNSRLKREIEEAFERIMSSGKYDALKMSWLTGGMPSDEE